MIIDSIIRENFQADEDFIQEYLNLLKPFKEKFESEIDDNLNEVDDELKENILN